MKTALITGITGQIGSFMADLLLEKKYSVYGMVRRVANRNMENIEHIKDKIHLIEGDLTDQPSLDRVLKEVEPDEIYNFAAQSHVATSFSNPLTTADITGLGVLRLLESTRNYCESSRFYQASSSEMFGNCPPPQNESSTLSPVSPYGASKVFAHNICKIYRDSYNMFIYRGICFNSESERRGKQFVTRKISIGASRSKLYGEYLTLGNLFAKRDWHYTRDTVEAIHLIMKHKPNDYVIASGESHTVKEFMEIAYSYLDLDWKKYVKIDKKYMRPTEIYELRGDCSKLKKIGWKPKYKFEDIIKKMVDSDLEKERGITP